MEAEIDDPLTPPIKKIRHRSLTALHRLQKYEGTARNTRKKCSSCYKKIQSESGVKEARNKAKRVCTFCENCPGMPTMCLPCFNENHK
ncbi:hypothetical protein NQ314_002652 [Rhamnusium bicolor]|uniref:PiggyBac transposable element-derived protein 4 C-terminal zinc-ribbon domain-containing protein n=1 Tax=Rhamnusium bicolor TaxID=1586634 RepID=A0AAV8ZRR7_9CUCU|nr:hypothetical protein NQ314_002652 [Rhamnusium bicolor]